MTDPYVDREGVPYALEVFDSNMLLKPVKPYDGGSHGWVTSRPDGMRTRCGGPAICMHCRKERHQLQEYVRQNASSMGVQGSVMLDHYGNIIEEFPVNAPGVAQSVASVMGDSMDAKMQVRDPVPLTKEEERQLIYLRGKTVITRGHYDLASPPGIALWPAPYDGSDNPKIWVAWEGNLYDEGPTCIEEYIADLEVVGMPQTPTAVPVPNKEKK